MDDTTYKKVQLFGCQSSEIPHRDPGLTVAGRIADVILV